MNGRNEQKDSSNFLSTQDKLAQIHTVDQVEGLGLVFINNSEGKTVYYDPIERMYWSIWNPNITIIEDDNISPDPIELPPSHDEADFVAMAQAAHFRLHQREDLASRIEVKHSENVSITTIPEIPGRNATKVIKEWERQGKPADKKPITSVMFAEFIEIMLADGAPENADVGTQNMIFGNDNKIYCIDYSLEFTGPELRDHMILKLMETALECHIPWEEIPSILLDANNQLTPEEGIDEDTYRTWLKRRSK